MKYKENIELFRLPVVPGGERIMVIEDVFTVLHHKFIGSNVASPLGAAGFFFQNASSSLSPRNFCVGL